MNRYGLLGPFLMCVIAVTAAFFVGWWALLIIPGYMIGLADATPPSTCHGHKEVAN